MPIAHPLAHSDEAQRILHHTIVDVCALLDADTFSLDGDRVTFRRRARAQQPSAVWDARLGDWLVPDPPRGWCVVADEPAAELTVPTRSRVRVAH